MAKAKEPVVRTHADKVADRVAGIETSDNAKTHGAALQGKPEPTVAFADKVRGDRKPGREISHPDGDFIAE